MPASHQVICFPNWDSPMFLLGFLTLFSFGTGEARIHNIEELRNVYDADIEGGIDPSLDADILQQKARQIDVKTDLRAQYLDLIECQKSMKRVRKAMMHTKLDREWKKNKKVLKALHDKYTAVTEHVFYHATQEQFGVIPSASELAYYVELDNMVLESDFRSLGYAEYPTDLDEDRGNIWFYFKDPLWEKKYYPFTFSYVWVSNEYRLKVKKDKQSFPDGNPYNYDENVLFGYQELRPLLLNDATMFLSTAREMFTRPSMEKFSQKGKLFGGYEDEVLRSFIAKTKEDFSRGVELRRDYALELAFKLAPSYLIVELFLTFGDGDKCSESPVLERLEVLRENEALMLDKMISAYLYAQMQFDLNTDDHKLSFGGGFRALGFEDEGFESTHEFIIGYRNASAHNKKMVEYKQIMHSWKLSFHTRYFNKAWPVMKSYLFSSGFEKDRAERLGGVHVLPIRWEKDGNGPSSNGPSSRSPDGTSGTTVDAHTSKVDDTSKTEIPDTNESDTREISVELVLKAMKDSGLTEEEFPGLAEELSKMNKDDKIKWSVLNRRIEKQMEAAKEMSTIMIVDEENDDW